MVIMCWFKRNLQACFLEWFNIYLLTVLLTLTAGQELQQSRSSGNPLQPTNSALQAKAIEVTSSLPVFDVESPYLPSKVKEAIKANKRPSATDRADMVGRIVDRCREIVPNFARAMLDDVGKGIVKSFPASFKDTILVSEHGSDCVARQLKVKFDNSKQPKDSKTAQEKSAPSIPQAFGCSNWNPTCPSDQTEESQQELMQQLQRTHGL